MRNRLWQVVGAGVVAAMLLTACGGGTESGGTGGSGGGEGTTLVIGGWGGAIDEATTTYYLEPFEAATGIAAEFVDAPGTQAASIEAQQSAGNVEWDLLDSVAGDSAFTLYSQGYLETLPDDVRAELEDILGPGKVTDFGFSHANVGHVIVCNMDLMTVCPQNMAEFFDIEQFPQSRMIGGIGAVFTVTMAQVAAGTPASETATTPIDLDAAFAQLDAIKPAVRVFYESGDQQLQVMRSGEVEMALMWSGRAYALKAEGLNVEINWGGGAYEPSYWAVVAGAPHMEAAFQLMIDIARNVEGQAGWANDLRYSVPNPDAIAQLPAEVIPELADEPSNFDQVAIPNFAWYVANLDLVNSRFETYLRG